MKILMVCLGNICRSPLAQGVLQNKANNAGLNLHVDSAGTNGYHNGEAPHYLSQKIALQNDIDISKQISRQFTKDDIEHFDKIYAMSVDVLDDIRYIAQEKFNDKKITLLLNEIYPNEQKDVPDPWSMPEVAYQKAFTLINSACEKIIKNLQTPQST